MKIILILSLFFLAGCTQKIATPIKAELPVIEKAKWNGNYASSLEDILRELEEYRAVKDSFK